MQSRIWVAVLMAVAILLLLNYQPATSQPDVPWWNNTWHYRLPFTVNTTGYERQDWPVEYAINFTGILQSLGVSGTFDENSTVLFETNSTGYPVQEMPSQFDPADGYDASSNAAGELVFVLNGTNAPGTDRHFVLYFDIQEKQSHEKASYSSGMNVTWDGKELEVNTTRLVVNIDTMRGENTSGIYDIYDLEGGAYAFENPCGPNDRTREWTELGNGSDRFGFDLGGNATITEGPVRITIRQSGEETYWDQPSDKTGQMALDKRYYLYRGTDWLRISQSFTNEGSGAVNRRANATALGLDADAAYNIGGGYRTDINGTDPGSWVIAQQSGGRPWTGYLNLNESGADFFAGLNASDTKPVGIWLGEAQIQPDASVGHQAIIVINVSGISIAAQDMELFQEKMLHPVSISAGDPERWVADIHPFSDHAYYNLNESVIAMGNITLDTWSLVNGVNATLDNGTSSGADDITIALYDDGTHGDQAAGDGVWSGYHNLTSLSNTGTWNLTVKAYDSAGYLLNYSSATFVVTPIFNVSISFANPNGLGERTVNATVNVTNYRRDTSIPGAGLNCTNNGVPVAAGNITDNSDGTYLVRFTAPYDRGTYYLFCNATKNGNLGNDTQPYYVEAPNTSISLVPSPTSFTAYNVTWLGGESFYLEMLVNNTGFSMAYDANFTLYLPSEASSNVTNKTLGNIPLVSSEVLGLNITVKNGTAPQTLSLGLGLNWTNFDSSLDSNVTAFNVTVVPTTNLSVPQDSLLSIAGPGGQTGASFTVSSYGNSPLQNVTFTITGLDPNITVAFQPPNMTSLAAGASQAVEANVSISANQSPGVYGGVLNVTANNSNYRNLTFEVVVTGTNLTITSEPPSFSATQVTYYQNQSFDVLVNVTNVGNTTAFYANVTISLPANLTSTELYHACGNLTAGSSCIHNFTVTIANNTPGGAYSVNASVGWADIGISSRSNQTSTGVTVASNVVLTVPEASLTATMQHGTTIHLGNVTLNSTGNTAVLNVSYSIAGMAGFTFILSPAFPLNLSPGAVQPVSVNATIAAGFSPGVYNGTLNLTAGNDGYHVVNISITVPQNGSWTMSPVYCEAYQSQDTGTVCNVTINNTGNMQLNFSISPASANFTAITDLAFTISKQSYHSFSVYFDITGGPEPRQWHYANYTVNATYSYSSPPVRYLFIGLNPLIEAEIDIDLAPNITQQLGNADITATITSLSGNPIECGSYSPLANCTVLVTVFRPDGNSSSHAMQYNGGQASGTSYWYVAYPDYLGDMWGSTLQRGNYTVSVFTQDNTSINSTANVTLRIYADLVVDLRMGKTLYKTGETGTVRYRLSDRGGQNLSGANTTITITDPYGYVLFNQSYATNANGTLDTSPPFPTFWVPDYPEGRYSLSSNSTFFDPLASYTTTKASASQFDVYDSHGLQAEVVTRDVWFPNSTMNFELLVKDDGGLPTDADDINLTVYYGNPLLGNVLFTANLTGNPPVIWNETGRYMVGYTMGPTTQSGDYWAVLRARKGAFSTLQSRAFSIAAWGPYDLRIELDSAEVRQGNWLDFRAIIDNKGEFGRDVDLSYWVEGNGQTWYSLPDPSPTYTPPGQNVTAPGTRAFRFSEQPTGMYTLHVRIDDSQSAAFQETSVTFLVTPGAPAGPPSGGGGAGGGEAAGGGAAGGVPAPQIEISKYPTEVAVMVGMARFPNIHVRNPGGGNLTNVTLQVSGIAPEWYDVSPKSAALGPNETGVFTVRILVPAGTKSGTRKVTIAAVSGTSRDEKTFDLVVFTSMKELVDYELQRLKASFEQFMIKVRDAEATKDLTEVLMVTDELDKKIAEAESYLPDEKYENALDSIYAGWSLLDRAEFLLSQAPDLFAIPWWALLLAVFGIMTAVLVLYIRRVSASLKILVRGRNMEMGKLAASMKAAPTEGDIKRVQAEKDRLGRMLKLLEQQQQQGIISKEAYEGLRKKTEEKLKGLK
jgi:uncharacterized membrane protein